MTLGRRIRNARENLGLTQTELGSMVGVSGVAIMRYEKDQRQPKLDMLSKIAGAMGLTASSLLPPDQWSDVEVTNMSIGDHISEYRKAKGLTQKQLAEILGVATGTVQQYELGKREPNQAKVAEIAKALGVDPFSIYDFDMATAVLSESINRKELASEMAEAFDRLNSTGQQVALERVEELTYVPAYQKGNKPPKGTE